MLTYSFLIIRLRIYKILREIQIKRIKISSAIFFETNIAIGNDPHIPASTERAVSQRPTMFGGSATAHGYFRIASKAAMYRQPLSASRIQEFDCRYPHTATASAGSFPTLLSQRHFKRIGRVGSLRHTKKNSSADRTKFRKKTDKNPVTESTGFPPR